MGTHILAIDPGYDRCGVALLERTGEGIERLLYSSCITTEPRSSFEDRLVAIVRAVRELIHTHKPSLCALEQLYLTSNHKTAMRVAEVRGALIALAREESVALKEFGPGQIKVAITGDGRASKKQIMLMVPRLVKISKEIRYDDEYDAIAIALTASALYRAVDMV